MNTAKKKDFIINFLYFASIILIIFFAYKYLFFTVLPFVIALFTATLVQKNAGKLESRIKIKKAVCALIMVIVLYIITAALIVGVGALFVLSFNSFKDTLVNLFSTIRDIVFEWKTIIENFLYENFNVKIDFGNMVSDSAPDIAGNLLSGLSEVAVFLFSKIPQILITVVVTVVAGCYFAYDFDKLKKFALSLLSEDTIKKTRKLRSIFKNTVLKILGGYLILMSVTFLVLSIGFFVIGIKPALYIALIISFVDLLPVLGTGTVLLPWAVFSFISGNTLMSVGVLVIYLVATILRNFLEPHIIGKRLGISPLFMLIAIFVGYKLLGIIGLIAAPMLLIVVYEYNASPEQREV